MENIDKGMYVDKVTAELWKNHPEAEGRGPFEEQDPVLKFLFKESVMPIALTCLQVMESMAAAEVVEIDQTKVEDFPESDSIEFDEALREFLTGEGKA